MPFEISCIIFTVAQAFQVLDEISLWIILADLRNKNKTHIVETL